MVASPYEDSPWEGKIRLRTAWTLVSANVLASFSTVSSIGEPGDSGTPPEETVEGEFREV